MKPCSCLCDSLNLTDEEKELREAIGAAEYLKQQTNALM